MAICTLTDAGQTGLHQQTGAVYRLRAAGAEFGELQKLIANMPSPAGLALSVNEESLFVAVAADNAIWRLPLVEGGVSRASRFLQLSGGIGPTGLTVDSDDNLFVAHHGLGCAWMFDKRGEPRYRIDSSRGDHTTSLTLDPTDPRVVLIAEAQTGTVLKASLPMY